MSWWRRLLGFLTGKKTARGSAGHASSSVQGAQSGQTSLLSMLLKNKAKIDFETCDSDGNTTAVPNCGILIYGNTESIQKLVLDVGGYCERCLANRCASHSIYVAVPLEEWERGREGVNSDIDIIRSVNKFASPPIDMVFLIGCRVCNRLLKLRSPMHTIVMT